MNNCTAFHSRVKIPVNFLGQKHSKDTQNKSTSRANVEIQVNKTHKGTLDMAAKYRSRMGNAKIWIEPAWVH